MNERKHHPYGPSKLQSLEACPGYRSGTSETEAALAGTRQHDATEGPIDLDDPKLTDAQAGAVAMCKAYRDRIIAKYPSGTVLVEEYLPIDNNVVDGFQGTTGGYLDVGVVSADETQAEICDWKFGFWSVEGTSNNLQGMAYLLGLVHRFPKLKQVTVHFCLPHRDEIDFHTFTQDQFDALRLRIATVVARAQKDDPQTYNPTVSGCLFCARKGTCPKLAEFALKVGNKYNPVKVPSNLTPSLFTDPKSSTISMEVAQLMEGWAKAVRTQITHKVIEDETAWMPEGYKLRSRTDNKIVDWRKVIKTASQMGVTTKAIQEALTVKMTPLYAGVRAPAPRGQKEAREQELRDALLESGALEPESPVIFLERVKT